MLNGYTFRNAASLARIGRMLELLQAPHTRAELAVATGVGIGAMGRYLTALKADKRIHICDWRKNAPGSPSPVYLVGNKPNKRRPRPLTAAEKAKRCRDRNPERQVERAMARRLERLEIRPDPLAVALFGAG